ncbi:MAG: S8 family serine peptidase, partial [Actinomycetota bacterium]|nr:S8 family serine peptidase [Actinomycetota bacterium]
VTATDGLAATASDVVQDVGGSIGTELGLIGSVSATVPAAALDTLRAEPAIASAVVDAPLQLTTAGWDDATKVKFNPSTYEGTVNRVGGSILQVDAYWAQGYDGSGVDVALIDSGVAPVNGLTYPGKIINGPDLSFEPQSDVFRHLDTFGHGTHMAGIIAGRDDGASTDDNLAFLGVAPGSRIVSVKVADEDGATDVSQVIAAIDWVVQHRNDDGLNIGVINLSFGTDSTQSYQLDPLAYAVEQAWKAGIVVVVAAGNDGNDAALRNPATDPFVIAVGATNSATTRPKVTSVLDFSNCGTSDRFVDVVVPGESIASLRVPGSNADDNNPQSVVAERYMLGSGTSQAAAFVSGTAALIIDRNPEATPDQVKALLMRNAGDRFRQTDALCVGAGLPNLEWVRNDIQSDGLPVAAQSYSASTGLGLLEDARGADHLENDSAILEGEQDIFGNAWDGTSWSTAAALGTSWSGGDWNGTSWSGSSWSGSSWSGTSWSGTSWSGSSWSGSSWSDTSWSDKFWSGTSWSGSSWSGSSWSGTSWSGLSWGQRPD